MSGKNCSIGAGYGHYESQNAMAIGMRANLTQSVRMTAGLGHGDGNTTANVGVGYGWIKVPASQLRSRWCRRRNAGTTGSFMIGKVAGGVCR